jgi:hypothetical protein
VSNSSNFSREALRPLVDRTVHLHGRLLKKQKQPDGSIHALLGAVKVRAYDPEKPALSAEPINVDHQWVQIEDKKLIVNSELLGVCEGLGRVHFYQRGDGSVDLGIRLIPCIEYTNALITLKAQVNDMNQGTQLAAFSDLLDKAKADLRNGTGWVYGSKTTMRDVVRDLSRHVEALERDQAAELKACLGKMLARNGGLSRRERREQERRLKRRHQDPSGPFVPTHVPPIHLHP